MSDVICFPQSRNIGRARHVAQLLHRRRSEQAQEQYWQTASQALWRGMLRAGISQKEAERQLKDFADAVRVELWKIDNPERRPLALSEAEKLYGEAHRVLDEGMADIVSSPEFHHDGPGAA